MNVPMMKFRRYPNTVDSKHSTLELDWLVIDVFDSVVVYFVIVDLKSISCYFHHLKVA